MPLDYPDINPSCPPPIKMSDIRPIIAPFQ